ncbi:hypothetical protein [Parasutterella sp.]|uniref:hypothetical protein n=1 Tax=Parasutterella sp. TaxID=2049037 RepID=UPI003521D121
MHKRSTLIVLFFSLSLAAGNVFASTVEKIEKLNAFELLAFVESLDQLEVTPENCRLEAEIKHRKFQIREEIREKLSSAQQITIIRGINKFSDRCWAPKKKN